jgi:hypothetical protein
MRHLGTFLLGGVLLTGCEKNSPPSKSPVTTQPPSNVEKQNSDAMRGLREMMLTSPAAKLGIQRSDDFPRTYGVLMDWPIGNERIATVVGLCDGNASLYTTSTFGVIGGVGHESVRKAAAGFVKVADKFYTDSVPTSDYPYPKNDRVKFYLVTFDGVRVIDADLNSISNGNDKISELFNAGQQLIAQLRTIVQNKTP